jgi:glutathionyl-hydroquinone reductase
MADNSQEQNVFYYDITNNGVFQNDYVGNERIREFRYTNIAVTFNEMQHKVHYSNFAIDSLTNADTAKEK